MEEIRGNAVELDKPGFVLPGVPNGGCRLIVY